MKIAFRSSLRGFTLIELIISIVLLGLLGTVGVTMFSDSFDTTRWINANQGSSAKSRYALERLERELREIKIVGGAYCTGALANPSTSLTFQQRQANSTDTTNCNSEVNPITISLATGVLSLQKSGTSSPLTDGVTAFSLNFLDKDNNPTTDNTALRLVVIDLTLNDTSGQAIAQRARVALRNL